MKRNLVILGVSTVGLISVSAMAAKLAKKHVVQQATHHVSHHRKHPKQKNTHKDDVVNVRGRDLYFCNEIVTDDEFTQADADFIKSQADKNPADLINPLTEFVKENTISNTVTSKRATQAVIATNATTTVTTEQKKTLNTWTLESHMLTVFSGGKYKNGKTIPTIISIDGVNDLGNVVKTPDPKDQKAVDAAEQDLLGASIDGYDGYALGSDTGLADEWGASVFLQKGLLSGTIDGQGNMIIRHGQEPQDDSDTIVSTQTSYFCVFNEGSIWPNRLR